MKNRNSLKFRLLLISMTFLSVAWLATLCLGYFSTERAFDREQDLQLKQMAASLAEVSIMSETNIEISNVQTTSSANGKRVEFQIWRNDKMVSYSSHAPKETLSTTEGFSQNKISDQNWRVFALSNGPSRVLVGEDLKIRNSFIHSMILSSLWPMLITWPLIALMLWLSVWFGLRPLSEVATAIRKRKPGQLTPISLSHIPIEVAPVVESLNHLLAVVETTLDREKHFADDAAHELRTPLAAIKTQAQLALRSLDEKEKSLAISAVNQGIDRAAKIVTQLLTLARMEPEHFEITFSKINLNSLVSQVVAKFVPQAMTKHIEISFNAQDQIEINGDARYLEIMASNLIDNAIRYTPDGGVILLGLSKEKQTAILSIEDTGPGIAAEERKRVFERFVRLNAGESEGSGIGLAIVKRIIDLHHASIELLQPDSRSGLIVRAIFPAI